jgi:Na+/melibiose symporter-like transporter
MPKANFSEINVKAAIITGAIIGFLAWLVMVPWYGVTGFSRFGMMGYMIGYSSYVFIPLSILVVVICSAIAGALIAIVYNWALKLK